MTIRRNDKLVPNADLAALLRVYEDGTRLENGTIHFTGGVPLVSWRLEELVPDAFTVNPALSRSKAIGLFRRALRQIRQTGPLTAQALLEAAQQLHHADRATPERTYTLWTKFRATSMPHHRGFRLRWDGVDLKTADYLPGWLRLDEYFLSGTGWVRPNEPVFYGHAILTCRDRDDHGAADRMLDTLQLMFGLINLYEGWGRESHYSGPPKPDGALWMGPYQFLFQGRRALANDLIWFNPEYREETWGLHPTRMDQILAHIPRVRRALAALEEHPLRTVIVKALRLMQDGFSARDANHRLLRYWSALEQLYVEEGARERSNQKVIDRAAFAESDPRLTRWVLNHIARLRNDYVHAGGGDHDLDAMSEFLRNLLGRHINHWIFTGQTFANHQAMLNYVSLPSDPDALRHLRDAIDRRLELNSRRRPRS